MAARLTLFAALFALTGCVELFDELPESARIRPEVGTGDAAGPDGDVADGSQMVDRGPAVDAMLDDGMPLDDGISPDEGMPLDDGVPIDRGPIPDGCAPVAETCNGLDDDCDGFTDEAGAGAPLTRACYTGPDESAGRGACRSGVERCVDGVFGACEDEVVPVEEICPSDGACPACNDVDDDCDGAVDEGLVTACGPDDEIGQCRVGSTTCEAGQWSECSGDVGASDEICDRLDNDCDGEVDEDAGDCQCVPGEEGDCYGGAPETRNVGICRGGRQQCEADGRLGECVGQQRPRAEVCNGDDDDCDGVVDEGLGGDACVAGRGVCEVAGVRVCRVGQGLVCDAVPGEGSPERCNALDDDCDGRVDEDTGVGDDCDEGVGACAASGQLECDGSGGVRCSVMPGPEGAEVCNGRDDDCDGTTDEGPDGGEITRACYAGPMAQIGVGLCRAGVETCSEGDFGACVGAVGPRAETCNSTDDDCDGAVDEGVADCECMPGESRDCYDGDLDLIGVGVCRGGRQSCQEQGGRRSFGACVGQVEPSAEVCDGDDDDCDGSVDEGTFGGCSAGEGECQRPGERVCEGGVLVCNAVEGPRGEEVCNDRDDDCDGITDEGTFGECFEGVGVCERPGSRVCKSGEEVCDAEPGAGVAETCNGEDDDCDGRTDEDRFNLCEDRPGGSSTCRRGVCDLVCQAGRLDANGVQVDGCEVGCARGEPVPIDGEAGAAGTTAIAAATSGVGTQAVAFVGAPPVVHLAADGLVAPVAFDLERIDGIDLARDEGGLALIAWHDQGDVVVAQAVEITNDRGRLQIGEPVAFEADGVPMLISDSSRGITGSAVALIWAGRTREGILRASPLPRSGAPVGLERPRDLDNLGGGWLGAPDLQLVQRGADIALVGLVRQGDGLAVRLGTVEADGERAADAPIEDIFERPRLAAAAGADGVLAVVGDVRATAVSFDLDELRPGAPVDLGIELTPGAVVPYAWGYVVAGVQGGEAVYGPIASSEGRYTVGVLASVGPASVLVGDVDRARLAWVDEARQVWTLTLQCDEAP